MIERWRRILLGDLKNFFDPNIHHRLALVAFFAWVGLGSDGISSSCYGPEEAFLQLGGHHYLAIYLMVAMVATILLISASYSQIIEQFPTGGGGYLVATKLLGPTPGVVSGCALVVDYILTISISVASGCEAIYSFLPPAWQGTKLLAEFGVVGWLILLNLRGVKESVLVLTPIFLGFMASHAVLILYGILGHAPQVSSLVVDTARDTHAAFSSLGALGVAVIFLRAFSLGGGTYTGIEAVSNGVGTLREPRVETGKRTMAYMAGSLAFTAGGILLCYLLNQVRHESGKTLNASLWGLLAGGWSVGGVGIGPAVVAFTLVSEGALLFVAAQTGFLVNVFLTFTLSQLGMVRHWFRLRRQEAHWRRRLAVAAVGGAVTATILAIMVALKLGEGGWVTLLATGALVGFCFAARAHYRRVRRMTTYLDESLMDLPLPKPKDPELAPDGPTAIVLVENYGGLGIHTVFSLQRLFPRHFKNLVFCSVGQVDSAQFKGVQELEALEAKVRGDLERYVALGQSLGCYSEYRYTLGTDLIEELEKRCLNLVKEFRRPVVFAGQLVFQRENLFTRSLHYDTAFAIQRRLQFNGLQVIILPIRVWEARRAA